MPVFYGNTSTSATSEAYDIPYKITNYSIVNRSGGAVTINLGVLYGSTFYIAPPSMTLSAGDTFYCDDVTLLLAGRQIYLSASGSVDYYFSLE